MMTYPGNSVRPPQSDTSPKVAPLVVAVATIIAGVAAVVQLSNKGAQLAIGSLAVILLAGIAISFRKRGDRGTARWFWLIAAIVGLVVIVHGLILGVSANSSVQPGSVKDRSSSSVPRTQTPTPTSSATVEEPEFEGSAKLVAGQAIDLESPNPTPKPASGVLSAPADVLVNDLGFVYDRGGYLLIYTGASTTAREGCQELLESSSRKPAFALPDVSYCVKTSEGRVALIRFGQGEYIGRPGGISYTVWGK